VEVSDALEALLQAEETVKVAESDLSGLLRKAGYSV